MAVVQTKQKELRKYSRYKSLLIARNFLLTCLLLLTAYTGYYGTSLVPFYLLALLSVLPSLLKFSWVRPVSVTPSLYTVCQNIGYSYKRHLTTAISFYFTLALLALWNVRLSFVTAMQTWLTIIPVILIISSLIIYTIGQYYYFIRYESLIMQNELDRIR